MVCEYIQTYSLAMSLAIYLARLEEVYEDEGYDGVDCELGTSSLGQLACRVLTRHDGLGPHVLDVPLLYIVRVRPNEAFVVRWSCDHIFVCRVFDVMDDVTLISIGYVP